MIDLADIDITSALPELKAWALTMSRCAEAMALYIDFVERHGPAPKCRRPLELERLRKRYSKAFEHFSAAGVAFTAALANGGN